MTEEERRRRILTWAVPAYFHILNRLSTPGSPAHLWAVGNCRVEAGLIARGVLPPRFRVDGDGDWPLSAPAEWHHELANTP